MTPETITQSLWVIYAFTRTVAAWRLYRTGAWRVLPCLAFWLAVGALKEIVLVCIGWRNPLYSHVWAALSIGMMMAAAGMVIETHFVSARFSKLPGRAPALAFLISIALAGGGAATFVANDGLPIKHTLTNLVFVADQVVGFSAAIFLILSAWFYRGAAVPVSRAIKAHRVSAIGYFFATALTYYLIHYGDGRVLVELAAMLMMVNVAIMVRWIALGPISEIVLPDATDQEKRYIRREIGRKIKPFVKDGSELRAARTSVASSR